MISVVYPSENMAMFIFIHFRKMFYHSIKSTIIYYDQYKSTVCVLTHAKLTRPWNALHLKLRCAQRWIRQIYSCKQKLMWRRTFCVRWLPRPLFRIESARLLESNHCNIYHLDFISSTILRPFVTQRLWGHRKLLQIQRLRIPPFVSITDNHNRLYGSPDTSNYNVYHVSWPWRNKGLKQPHQRKKNLRNKNHHRSIVEKSERF